VSIEITSALALIYNITCISAVILIVL